MSFYFIIKILFDKTVTKSVFQFSIVDGFDLSYFFFGYVIVVVGSG